MIWDDGVGILRTGRSSVAGQVIELPCLVPDQRQGTLANVVSDLKTATEVANAIASNDQLLDQILGT